jgi:peptide/nickel transport system ATP-binding protein
MRIEQTIAEPIDAQGRLTQSARRARVQELLAQVGLSSAIADRYPYGLSGGQRQRVAIARALACEPRLIVCDEAVSALDVSTQAQVINLLRDLQATHGLAYLFVSHDLGVIHHVSDRIAVMRNGQLVELGTAAQIFCEPRTDYTRQLLSSRRAIATVVETDMVRARPPMGTSGAP